MASVTGSRLAFFGEGVDASKINVVLTTDGSDVAGKAIAGDLNIEVFTATPGSLDSTFQASAFIQGAQLLSNNAVQAGAPNSTEEILASNPDKGGSGFTGNLVLDDFGGGSKAGEAISIVGSNGQTYSVFGSAGDTITGSTSAAVSNYIDASGTLQPKNPPNTGGPFPGPETVQGGAGATTVRGGAGDVITGGAGSMVVTDENHVGNQTVVGSTGSLEVFNTGQKLSVTGSTASWTLFDDAYGNAGGGSSIVGGSGTNLLASPDFPNFHGENTAIIASATDQITVGSALTYVNADPGNVGNITITGGNGSTTGTVEGAAGYNTNILAGKGDVITLGSAATWIDANTGGGGVTITGGGPGKVHVEAGSKNSITGGSGTLEVNNIGPGSGNTIKGVIGNLFSFGTGGGDTITGSQQGWTLIDSAGFSNITGGNGTTAGTVTGAGGIFDNTIINTGTGDTVTGSTGGNTQTTYINANVGKATVTAGSGPTTVLAGTGDSITGGSGTLEADFNSDKGAATVNLGAGHGAATLRDISVSSGTSAISVTGFNTTTDTIASKTTSGATLLASAKSDGHGGTILTFNDNTTMTLAGVGDPTKIHFTS